MTEQAKREDTVGTIEHTRKLLEFLKTLPDPTPTARDLIHRYELEVAAYLYDHHQGPRD